jgi:hypothetical protein
VTSVTVLICSLFELDSKLACSLLLMILFDFQSLIIIPELIVTDIVFCAYRLILANRRIIKSNNNNNKGINSTATDALSRRVCDKPEMDIDDDRFFSTLMSVSRT